MSTAIQLPAANEFSPGQLGGPEELFNLLSAVTECAGDRDAIVEWIRARWFSDSASKREDPADRLVQQQKRAANVLTGMQQYGLIETTRSQVALTDLGDRVSRLADHPSDGLREFATFLLRERRGLDLIEASRAVGRQRGKVSKAAVDLELRRRGFVIPTNSSYSGKLRQWLAAAGVVDDAWQVNEPVLAELSGVGAGEVDDWSQLSDLQQAAVKILRIRAEGDAQPIQSHDFLQLLRLNDVEFDEGQVRRRLYEPLAAGGWITHHVAPRGRGGKGGTITLTNRALDLDLDRISGLATGAIPGDLRQHLSRATWDVLKDLSAGSTHARGLALEVLAVRIAADAGLLPIELRRRGDSTGGAEVDLVAEAAQLHFSRWLIQCKNQTAKVGVSVLAKELGLASVLKAQVIVVLTTSTFAHTVYDFARKVAESTAVQFVLLDGLFLTSYSKGGQVALHRALRERSAAALGVKREQLFEVPKEQ